MRQKALASSHADSQLNTFKTVATDWLQVKKGNVSPDYATDVWRSLELHIFPALGNTPISQVTPSKVRETLQPIAARGTLETVRRLCQRLNEVMIFGINTGLIESNPISGISYAFPAPLKRNFATIKPNQLPDLMRTLAVAQIKLTTRCLIEWQLHTMTRPSEAAGTMWSEIDIENQLWTIPAERMKKKKKHIIPLTPQALSLLQVMHPISTNRDFVFPSDKNPKTHINEQTANMALKRMGYQSQLVAHGLRSLASTTLNEKGFDPDVVESALAHTDSNSVRAAYNRAEYLDRRREMMDWWSSHIEKASIGNLSLSTFSQ